MTLRPKLACAGLLVPLLALSASASAQEPPQPPPPPPDAWQQPVPSPPPNGNQPPSGYGQPGYPPPSYPQPSYPPGYAPPPAGYQYPPGYGPPPGYAPPGYPPQSPPPVYVQQVVVPPGYVAVQEAPGTCCRWAFRADPFDLLYRRLTFDLEYAVAGPISVEIDPSWIFGSSTDQLDEKGFSVAANVAWYFLSGKAMHGLWLKAQVAYENFGATLTNPGSGLTASARASSAVLGALFGTSTVFGRNGGFALSGGIGIGVATAHAMTLLAPGNATNGDYSLTLYDNTDRIRLLGTMGIGVSF